jgi:hypothetical protein
MEKYTPGKVESDSKYAIQYMGMYFATSRGSITNGKRFHKGNSICPGKVNKGNRSSSSKQLHNVYSDFSSLLIIFQLYYLMLIFTTLPATYSSLFGFALTACIAILVPQIHFHQLSHTIVHVKGCAGRRSHVKDG